MRLSDYLASNREKFSIPNEFNLSVYDDIQINIDEDMDNYSSYARRPYYRLRGKPVTEEQAFEVIRRTDTFFLWEMDLPNDSDYIGSGHIRNWWFARNHFPSDMGWIHRDGTLGGNGITDKYPEFDELLFEMIDLVKAFPYLDFVLAITVWNELPDEMWNSTCDDEDDEEETYNNEDYEGFYEAIDIGFWVHDNTIDVLESKRAAEKFKEYEEKYGVADPSYYSAYYNMANGIRPCDVDYLKRAIEAYGLNPEEELSKISEYVWKGRK